MCSPNRLLKSWAAAEDRPEYLVDARTVDRGPAIFLLKSHGQLLSWSLSSMHLDRTAEQQGSTAGEGHRSEPSTLFDSPNAASSYS